MNTSPVSSVVDASDVSRRRAVAKILHRARVLLYSLVSELEARKDTMMGTMTRTAVLVLVTFATISVSLGPAAAQVKYTDRDGKSHWVQSEAQVPEEYRAERPYLPGTGGGAGSCNSGDPKRDASCNRAEWRSAMTKLCYVYGANTDDCREFRRVNAQRNVRDMMRR